MTIWLSILLILLASAIALVAGFLIGFLLCWKVAFNICVKITSVIESGGEIQDVDKFVAQEIKDFVAKRWWR